MVRTRRPRRLNAALLLWLALAPPLSAQPVPTPPAEAARQRTAFPTTDFSLALLILLPDRRDGLTALQRQLTSQRLEQAIEAMKDTQVDLALPRFRLRARPA